eukprot:gnl/TRDRNA2_/TRDRNA2_39050_c0_seq1.p1 gnl/TRDRNA2_/TRDRNA2_39050_c0~~gnl/TRDRNA2_/TRDRNA2_39050_c0_seq1.p1  ORF type:complete len:499 (+),score=85.44 gnl/TRDRNA2_/TRDRNA2_39050_c0_seq1:82-1497(+)
MASVDSSSANQVDAAVELPLYGPAFSDSLEPPPKKPRPSSPGQDSFGPPDDQGGPPIAHCDHGRNDEMVLVDTNDFKITKKVVNGVETFTCTCVEFRTWQFGRIDAWFDATKRSCAHLREFRGRDAEAERVGNTNLDLVNVLPSRSKLAKRFGANPFTVLGSSDPKSNWASRKKEWKSQSGMGLPDSTEGRAHGLAYKNGAMLKGKQGNGTSEFDPVLAEVACKWWAGRGCRYILDPFAGGSVRGLVVAALGHRYLGIDIRKEQVETNNKQKDDFCFKHGIPADRAPVWLCGDAQDLPRLLSEYFEHNEQELPWTIPACQDGQRLFDFVLTCPPYYDLEKYSTLPNDLSNAKSYEDFLRQYADIVRKTLGHLKDKHFACFVVGARRDVKTRELCDLAAKTHGIFESHGARLFNKAVHLTPTGSAPPRASRNFPKGGILTPTHQEVLVFAKNSIPTLEEQASLGLLPVDEDN